ncbi:hypothetical protein SAMN05216276_100769 [Streptosporangium subroseum]|uniref:DUF7824 domain-containing protein n=1 Tax=Streptosporangium subroseum TaxID=106412 RepID=A0A239DEF5_9ACTN|nr:DUF6493 family protein [Streptosporangium subroseum]SNS30103.1 hypothetical protein SAMN05216276_100769 [Streptosporangium subroseum]
MTLWDEIRALIDARDLAGLGTRLAVLDDAGRREVARELPGHLKLVRRARNLWEGQGDWAEPMRVAGAGSLGGAAAVAAWLNRRDLVLFPWDAPRDTEALIKVISAREPQWQADLVARLALRIRDGDSPGAPLVMTLLRRTGVTPPQHDPLVLAWLGVTPSASRSRADPLLDVLLPRIFEAQGVGRALLDERSSPLSATSWLGVLAVLSSEGRVSRGMLLDGCVSRFLRGGDAQDLRFFARLHELLEPSPAEVESRARDYLRLLPVAPGPVAELSLKHLRRLDHLDPADVTEALEGLLFRAEGGLVRTGLTWLDQIVRQAPTRADELAPALATALGHGAHAVQERAVRLAVKHARHLTPPGAETLRAALATLPPDLGRQLAGAVGGEAEPEEEPEAFTPPELTAPEPAGPLPALPASVAEFENTAWFSTWQSVESWLASFARFATEDPEALRVALGRRTRHAPTVYGKDKWYSVSDWFTAMAAELVSPGAEPDGGGSEVKEAREFRNVLSIAGEIAAVVTRGFLREFGREVPAAATRGFLREVPAAMTRGSVREVGGGGPAPRKATPDRLPDASRVSVPHRFLLRRCAEVLAALKEDRLPSTLLATPTHDTGHLDPAEFLTRLEAVEAAGAEPMPADFQQALLRLPRTAGPEIVARAARLTSEAGRRAARWLADGPADPATRVRWKNHEDLRTNSFGERESGVSQGSMIAQLRVEPTGLVFVDELLGEASDERWGKHGGHLDWWPAFLPSHRDAVAAHYVPHLTHSWEQPVVQPAYVEMLAAADGPAGDATALLLAFFLARQHPDEGVRLLLRMAARGDLPVVALGRQLALLTTRTGAKLPHATAGLEQAARQGAHWEVWAVIRAALPHLLPKAGERPATGVTDLVTLGVTVAQWAGARGEIPEVTAVAGRKSSSRFTRECRRLRDLLVRP